MVERILGYNDRYTQYITNTIVADTSGDSIFNDMVLDSDTEYNLVLTLTGGQYMKMFAALMTGADLSYQSEAHDIVWLLWKAGKDMALCNQVAQCITSSEATNTALAEWSINTGTNTTVGNPEQQLPETVRQESLLSGGFVCDNDHRYGMAVGIVEAIHKATNEVFQAIEVLTNPVELAAEVADNIPIAEIAASAADVVTWIQDTIYEVYSLAWSDTVKDEISCEIYCAMLPYDPCYLSFDMVFDIYKDLTGITPPSTDDNWNTWFDWLVGLPSLISVDTVKAGGLLGLICMKFGAMFGDWILGIRSFSTTVKLLESQTNANWDVLCTDCPSRWSHEFDLTNGALDGWGITTNGNWVLSSGVVAEEYSGSGTYKNGIVNLRLFGLIPRCDTFRIIGYQERGSWSSNYDAQAFYLLDAAFQPIGLNITRNQGLNVTGAFDWEWSFNLTDAANGLYVQMLSMNTTNSVHTPGTVIIEKIILGGEGIDPFGL